MINLILFCSCLSGPGAAYSEASHIGPEFPGIRYATHDDHGHEVTHISRSGCVGAPCAVPPCCSPIYWGPWYSPRTECIVFDYDGDEDVDLEDVAEFQRRF